ncbi:MAG: immune inhibitor A, partial [Candidatus Krumholzibacteria bacterium]|nr:immune inhibitor A [Candidatus Krumholzibacteria bacterium]
LGLEFRRLDMEGPDRIPGTGDDDGEVDGVLILHAGIGQENDPDEGLVQALQFFLADPVISQGISATFYAVASLQSGPGIWAHETGHLLGLEDRYDPGLRPAGVSEVVSLGGLGRFSLMASGAWGTGDGYGAALPDAYSCLQLGWYKARNLANGLGVPDTLTSGRVDRLWSRGEIGPEFFLLETRDPVAAFPFDADIPSEHLLIYHIDESLPEGQHSIDGVDTWHLRATLVEADDDLKLLRGEDAGRAEDLFPGPLGKTDFGPSTIPSSHGYKEFSGVSLTGITPISGGVTYQTTVWPDQNLEFTVGFGGQSEMAMDLVAKSSGAPLSNLRCWVDVSGSPAWGTFADGGLSVAFEMVDDGWGSWRPSEPVIWIPDADIPSDAHTVFTYNFQYDEGAAFEPRTWYWKDNRAALDFGAEWPGEWEIGFPAGNDKTTWHRWDRQPWLTGDQSPVLACTGSEFTDSGSWPEVNYQNSAFTTLTSGNIGPDVRAVRIIHGMEVEYLTADVAMDGGLPVWVDPSGREIPAEPLTGWRGRIAPKSLNELHGKEAMVQEKLEDEAGIPLWRTDIIPVPDGSPGPWRLRLSFGSNSLWRYRGWFVAGLDPIQSDPAGAVFDANWVRDNGTGLTWSWPWEAGVPQRFIIQHRTDPDDTWQNIADELFSVAQGESGYVFPANRVYPFLDGSPLRRNELRVIGSIDKGMVTTYPVVVFPDGGDGQPVTLSLPWPNPAHDTVRVFVEIPSGILGSLGIYDLRGRRVMERSVGAGSHLLEWDGRDSRGGRTASGTYIIRLEGSGPAVMRKVVLLH